MPTALWNAKGTDVTKNSILDVKGDLRSAHDYSYYYRISVTEPHLKFISATIPESKFSSLTFSLYPISL